MEPFPYKHAAIFANEVAAMNVVDQINQAAFPDIHLLILKPDTGLLSPEGNTLRQKTIRDAVYGSTGGAIGAAAASVTATSLKIAAFVAHPWLVGVAAVGYGTLLGGAGGAVYGELKGDAFIQALDGALKSGHWVVVVHSKNLETDQQVSQLLEQTFTEDMV